MKVLENKRDSVLFSFVLIMIAIAYIPSIAYGIGLWYNNLSYINNDLITSITPENLLRIFSEPFSGSYQPLVVLSFAIEHSISGTYPVVFHFNNLLLHLLNTLLVYILVFSLTKKNYLSLVISFLFGLHPLQASTVIHLSGRSDLLFTLFYLLAFNSYLKYKGSKVRMDYLLVFIYFLFSCFSSWLAVSLPFVLLLSDYFLDGRITVKKVIQKLPLFAVSLVFLFIAFMMPLAEMFPGIQFHEPSSFFGRLLLISHGFIFNIEKLFVPLNLNILYFHFSDGYTFTLKHYISFVITIIFLVSIVLLRKSNKNIFFGGLLYILTIFPILILRPLHHSIMPEAYFYLSSIGLLFIFINAFDTLAEKLSSNIFNKAAIVLILLISIVFIINIFNRSEKWKNSESFWGEIIISNPDHFYPYFMRGKYYLENDSMENALSDLSSAIARSPEVIEIYEIRSRIYYSESEYENCLADLQSILNVKPDDFYANFKSGEIYGKHYNQLNKAEQYLQSAYNVKKDDYSTVFYLGVIKATRGEYENALEYFNKALQIRPNDIVVLSNIKQLYYDVGLPEKAEEVKQYISTLNK
jgi:tetratricopeptide (TPR) repeat protein